MASGISAHGVDLDSYFRAYTSGSKAATTGTASAGSDLRNRYMPYTNGPKAAITGISKGGTDLRDIFQSSGAGPQPLPVDGQHAYANELLTNQQTGYAIAEFVAKADGTYELHTVESPNGGGSVVASGTWNTLGGSASDYEVLYQISNIDYPSGISTGTSKQNDASSYTTMNAGRSAYIRVDGSFNSGTRAISATLTISFRRKSDNYVFAVASIYLSAHIDGSV